MCIIFFSFNKNRSNSSTASVSSLLVVEPPGKELSPSLSLLENLYAFLPTTRSRGLVQEKVFDNGASGLVFLRDDRKELAVSPAGDVLLFFSGRLASEI
jgi:hypothetical protein